MEQASPPAPDLKALMGRALIELRESKAKVHELEAASHAPVAIIGMDCRFPGSANSPEAFWDLLAGGVDAIGRVPAARWDADACFDPDPDQEGKICTTSGAFIDRAEHFDAAFFGISPREAQSMDPQHRLLLETSWRALEHANCAPARLRGSSTGVFIGICTYDYAVRQLESGATNFLTPHFGTGNALSAAAGRIAYLFGLNGPALSVDTACSSSLVSVHLACQSLRRGESSLALAGGVNLLLARQTSMNFSRAHMLSSDGHCKAFDAAADGYVRGEGCGVVVLKLLADAVRDGDPILAVVRGSAVNQDGASSGLTVPNGPAQQAVIRQALADASVEPAAVTYVEAHGTGTALGDPIEAGSLGAVYGAARGAGATLRLGSVKTNIGHLEGAAGVAGLIKTVLALQHRQIPASLHLKTPNPNIDWTEQALAVVTELTDWPHHEQPLLAGVSSFGFTGTNAHLIVEAAPPSGVQGGTSTPVLLPCSARDPKALAALCSAWSGALDAAAPEQLTALARVAALGREHLRYRRAVLAESTAAAARLLAQAPAKPAQACPADGSAPPLAFLFSGQGGQHSGMGRSLYDSEAVFRATIDQCDRAVLVLRGQALLPVLFDQAQAVSLDHTAWTQVALYALECALSDQWRSWGIEPVLVGGHSVGAYAAAYSAKVFTLDDGLALICARAALMGALAPGQGEMAALLTDEQSLKAVLDQHGLALDIACINAHDAVVVAGAVTEMARLEAHAHATGMVLQRLNVSHAFHSRLVEPMLDQFRRVLGGVVLRRPQVKFISDLTGAEVDLELTDPDYWVRHARHAVRFADLVASVGEAGVRHVLELGPAEELCRLGRRCPAPVGWMSSLGPSGQHGAMLATLATLYEAGAKVDWSAVLGCAAPGSARLPGYPFDGARHWIEPRARALPASAPALRLPLDPHLRFDTDVMASTYLADHQVFGQALVPAAALVGLLLAAGEQALGSTRLMLQNFSVRQPLLLSARQVQTVLEADGALGYRGSVFALGDTAWELVAEGALQLANDTDLAWANAASAERADWIEQDVGSFYAACAERGLDYGPAFRPLARVERAGTSVRAHLVLPDGADYPVMLDGCFQAAGHAFPMPEAGHLFIPVSIDRLVSCGRDDRRIDCQAESSMVESGAIDTALSIHHADGSVLARLCGLTLVSTNAQRMTRSPDQGLHHLLPEWVLAPASHGPGLANAPVLLLHADGDRPDALEAAMRAAGARVRMAGLAHTELAGTVVLWCPPSCTPSALAELLADTMLALLLRAESMPGTVSRVLLVTRGAQPVAGAPTDPANGALWGLARSLRAEYHGFALACADTDGDSLALLVSDLAAALEPELGYRAGQRYQRQWRALAPATAGMAPIRPGVSYLITGANGDIGRHVAAWLVANGADHLALLGRAAPSDKWDIGTQVKLVFLQADLGEAADVDAAFARMAAEMPPLAAIFHAAGVRQDGAAVNLTRAQFEQVLRPKTLGTLHLFERARSFKLDAMICFSSIAASFGSAGQANYAAANAWLDSFAAWARAQGVPVQALAFGPWDDTGMVRELTPGQRAGLQLRGIGLQSVAASLDALDHCWRSGAAHMLAYSGRLPEAPAAPALQGALAGAVAAILRLRPEQIDPEVPLVALGLDSLMALELRSWCRKQYDAEVSVVDLIRDMTLAQLNARLEKSSAPAGSADAPQPDTDTGLLPLTMGQRALWFLHRIAPQSPAYHIAITLRLRSEVDVSALAAALAQLATRHDMLRSVYLEGEDGPRRRVDAAAMPQLVRQDASGLDEAALFERVRADYRLPFDLASGPLMRVSLFARASDDHVLLVAIHHIAADAWSLWQLMDELSQLYEGVQAALAAPAYRFADRVRAEGAYLASAKAGVDAAYWERQLGGTLPLLNIATDKPRAAIQGMNGASVALKLDEGETAALQELARREGSTLYAVLLAAFHCLMHRYSGQDDILIGCPTAGRDRAAAAATIGYFVNPVVVRARMAPSQPFRQLLQDVRQGLLDAMAHQELPFPAILERLGNLRNPGHPPLFQVAFVMQQLPASSSMAGLLTPDGQGRDWAGLKAHFYGLPQQEGQFDLALEMLQSSDCVHGLLKYNSDLWCASTIERMTGHLRTLLRSIVAAPGCALDRLDMLPATERTLLLVEWNATARNYDLQQPLHGWIERQAASTPHSIAAEIDDRRLTYAELNAAANRFALRLQAAGIGNDDLVGICAERSLELLVGLLAIVKAGGAYVPFDVASPAQRLGLMVADAAPKVMLTHGAGSAAMAPHAAAPWSLDGCLADVGDPGNPVWRGTGQSLAYAIYTSGSTGLPKGALNTHAGTVNRLMWMQEAFTIGPTDRVLQKTPYTFDVSVWEVFWPLMCGARIVFARPDGQRDNAYLATLIQQRRISVLHFVPPMLQAFLEVPAAAACTSLRRVVCSGQELPATLQRQFFALFDDCELDNLYGPTEAAVDVTWHRCRRDDLRSFVPIGKPIANTAMYILDRHGEPAARGLAGELYIGGVQVARGYLKREQLSAERFIADPFGGERLYRTGDLARFLDDGSIAFLGRNDFQVKIRGQRVELGEIEHALASQPGVRAAVVMLREERAGISQLVAYCVGTHEPQRLRAALAVTLAPHMLPDAFVFLDALPLTSSGKVDRSALATPSIMQAAPSRPAQGEGEIALSAIWKELLKLDQVGVDENFFSLGGDSIRSAQLVFRAERAGLRLSVRDVLEHPTVAALAALAAPAEDLNTASVDLSDEGDLPLLPMQNWFRASAPQRFNQALMLRTAQLLDPAVLRLALDDLARRHLALRLRINADGQTDGRFGVVLACWSDTDAIGMAQALGDINPATGAPSAALLIDAAGAPALLLCAHHLVVDGVSWRTLLSDLETAYLARLSGVVPRFEAAALYGPWVRAVAAFGKSAQAEAEALYWLCQDWNVPRALSTAVAPSGEPSQGAAEVTFALPFDDVGGAGQRTEAMLLVTLAQALGSAAPLRVDLEGHGRETLPGAPDGGDVVGWCSTLYPVVLPSPTNDTAASIAALTAALAEVPASGRSFGICRDYAARSPLRAALARIGQADILFNYLGDLGHALPEASMFSLAPLDPELLRDAGESPRYRLEINAYYQDGQLHIELRYDVRLLDAAWMQALANRWQTALARHTGPGYRLTPMQQGILLHSLVLPEAGLYVTQLVVELEGEPDAARLRNAWDRVLRRHAVLRNAFEWRGLDAPLQHAIDEAALPWREIDGDVSSYLTQDRSTGFALDAAPLLRVALLREADTFTLVWTHHHLLLDGRAMFMVLGEVVALYSDLDAHLPAPAGFRQFAERAGLADPIAAQTYWRAQLADIDAAAALPFLSRAGTPAPPLPAELRHLLPAASSARLVALARANGVTPNVLLQSILALLLQRLSGSEQVVFGAAVAAPTVPGLAHAGLYINTVPVVFRASQHTTLGPWLRQAMLDQAARSPFEQCALVDIQACSRVPAGQPLFELLFLFENYVIDDALRQDGPGLRMRRIEIIERNHFPITLSVLPGESIELRLAHDLTRYSDAAAQLFLRQYVSLLESATSADTPLATLDSLDPALRKTMLIEWNATSAPADTPLAHLAFLAQARRTPDAIALRWQGAGVAYAELATHALAIAAALAARGIGPGQLVGLCCERSPRLLAGLFGILISGAAYVPLDPGFPAERLAYMLDDAGATLTLSELAVDISMRERLAPAAPLLLLDDIGTSAAPPPIPAGDPAAPMYVIYTSGSTGLPKGVVVSHANVGNFLASMARTPGIGAHDALLAVTTLSFDIAVLELLLPLSVGACVVLASRIDAADPLALMALMTSESVSIMQATPATWRMMLAAGWQGRQGMTALCGGEALPTDLSAALRPACAALWNMYGPTETTIWSALHRVGGAGAGASEAGVEPVGHPIANTRLYILDDALRPLPVGAAGQLYIGGDGVAIGYHRRPELSAARFIADPFVPGARMYCTGDRARYLPDGCVQFLGRLDHQVKLRGHRIELGEIEAVLGAHPQVDHCAVLIGQDADGGARLIAYHTPGTAPDASLRKHLRESLPEYMVPAIFMALTALPLTPNNKIDRKALPQPASIAQPRPAAPPRAGTEAALAAIWGELLGRADIACDQSFFDLGGNSLQLVGVQSRIALRLGVELAIVDLFRHTSVAALATHINTMGGAAAENRPAARPSPAVGALRDQAELRRAARTRRPTNAT